MFRWLVLVGLVGSFLPTFGLSAPADDRIRGSALLGTTQTLTLEVRSPNALATQAQLYEAWAVPAARKPASQPLRVPLPPHSQPLDPLLKQQLARTTTTDMIVYFHDQVDLSPALAITDWNERGRLVVALLQDHAQVTQQDVLAYLQQQGYIAHSYWIVNALRVEGNLALAENLAGRGEVAFVAANTPYVRDITPTTQDLAGTQVVDDVPWGLHRINAPRTWAEWGVRGQGIVVANLDTGVQGDHPALQQAYRGWSPGAISHDYNWFDGTSEPSAVPFDADGHGTHTMGTVVGGAFENLRALGVAPAARWIAARGCRSHFCDQEALMASAQWMLAPTRMDGSNPRPDLRPHIINNSWSGDGENPWYQGYVQAWNAAGIVSIFANGNKGAIGCGGSEAPGVYADAFSVGATGEYDEIATFSSRGHSSDGRIKPDMSAPGVGVLSAVPANGGTLEAKNGTSMAAPHVAGVATLMWSANPLLIGDLPATYDLLKQTSVALYSEQCGDGPEAVPNAVYGWGRLDSYAVLEEARVDVPWLQLPKAVDLAQTTSVPLTLDGRQVSAPGTYTAQVLMRFDTGEIRYVSVEFEVQANPQAITLHGQLLDRRTKTGITGRLQFNNGPAITTAAHGLYQASLLPGTYELTTTSIGYVPQLETIVLDTSARKTIQLVRDAPQIVLETRPVHANVPYGGQTTTTMLLSNIGTQPLSLTAFVPPNEWSVQHIDQGVRLYDLQTLPALALEDDQVYTDAFRLNFTVPIFGSLADSIYVSSNGWISTHYRRGAQPSARCLPDASLPRGSLAPFWTDLNPEQGGAIRAGHVTPDTFVVSYENVPRWSREPSPQDPTYTFQVALHADGTIEYIYGAMGRLPTRWSIGAGFDTLRGQSFACHTAHTPLANRRFELMNQAPADVWLSATPEQIELQPGDFTTLTVEISGVGHRVWRTEPLEGVVRLVSNDPLTTQLDIEATMLVGAPTTFVWMPILRR